MKNNTPVNSLIISGFLIGALLHSNQSTANANLQVDESPSLEFLEFLGSWEDSSGQWLDPYQLQGANELDNNVDKENKLNDEQTPHNSDDKKNTIKEITNEK